MKSKKYAVIGIGQFGRAIAKTLSLKGAEVLALDSDPEVIDDIAEHVSLAVAMDATDKRALISQNITDFDAVVVAFGHDFEKVMLCSVILQDLGVKRIISRANGRNQRFILEKIGINEILSPEYEIGIIVAERLRNPSIVSYLQFPDDYRIAEIKTPAGLDNVTLEELNIRNKYRLSLITIKQEIEVAVKDRKVFEQHIEGVPSSKTVLKASDTLVVFGKNNDIERFININQ